MTHPTPEETFARAEAILATLPRDPLALILERQLVLDRDMSLWTGNHVRSEHLTADLERLRERYGTWRAAADAIGLSAYCLRALWSGRTQRAEKFTAQTIRAAAAALDAGTPRSGAA